MTEETLPLGSLLHRISDELASQAEAVRELHGLVESGNGAAHGKLVEAQSIDTISQHLSELSLLLAALSQGEMPEITVKETVIDQIPLSGLQNRLKGHHDPSAESGEVDFF